MWALSCFLQVVEVMPRDIEGHLFPNFDVSMEVAVGAAEDEVPGAFYVIHAALSKTGLLMPSHKCVEDLLNRYSQSSAV